MSLPPLLIININKSMQKYNTRTSSLRASFGDIIKLDSKQSEITDLTTIDAITAQSGLTATGGDVVISQGVLAFEDMADGTVSQRSGMSGYQWLDCSVNKPANWNNGICYDFGTLSSSLNLSSIRFSGTNNIVQTCEIWFTTGATTHTVTYPTGTYWIDTSNSGAPTLSPNMHYRMVLRQEPNKIIASVAYAY